MKKPHLLKVLCVTSICLFAVASTSSAQQLLPVDDFVHSIYIHGVPYDEATKYGLEDAKILLSMLQDNKEQPYWSNIVVTLGMIGNDSAVEPLIAFISKEHEGEIPASVFNAKTSALISLGYLVNKSGSEQALRYLSESSDPRMWKSRSLGWDSPFHRSKTDRDVDLAKAAVLGLALTGRPEAKSRLSAVSQLFQTENEMELQTKMAPVLSHALDEYEKIRVDGLSTYYKNLHELQ